MSKPRERWWSYVKRVIRGYPEDKKALAELRKASTTQNYNANGGGAGGPGRATESVAMRELPPKRQSEMNAVERALAKTKRRRNGDVRCKLIELVFFTENYTLQGAALKCYVSYETARLWHKEFIYTVAAEMGLMD